MFIRRWDHRSKTFYLIMIRWDSSIFYVICFSRCQKIFHSCQTFFFSTIFSPYTAASVILAQPCGRLLYIDQSLLKSLPGFWVSRAALPHHNLLSYLHWVYLFYFFVQIEKVHCQYQGNRKIRSKTYSGYTLRHWREWVSVLTNSSRFQLILKMSVWRRHGSPQEFYIDSPISGSVL